MCHAEDPLLGNPGATSLDSRSVYSDLVPFVTISALSSQNIITLRIYLFFSKYSFNRPDNLLQGKGFRLNDSADEMAGAGGNILGAPSTRSRDCLVNNSRSGADRL